MTSIEEFWPRLSESTREWFLEHAGEALTPEIVSEVVQAGGPVATDAWWEHQDGPSGFYIPDEAVDWIEEMNNWERS